MRLIDADALLHLVKTSSISQDSHKIAYVKWLEEALISMNPDWVCEGMYDAEFTRDWCSKYCGKDDAYITPKCLHMYYHHIARADRKRGRVMKNEERHRWN